MPSNDDFSILSFHVHFNQVINLLRRKLRYFNNRWNPQFKWSDPKMNRIRSGREVKRVSNSSLKQWNLGWPKIALPDQPFIRKYQPFVSHKSTCRKCIYFFGPACLSSLPPNQPAWACFNEDLFNTVTFSLIVKSLWFNCSSKEKKSFAAI